MGISKTQLATDLGNMIADLPGVITVAGVTYAGVFTDLNETNALEVGGLAPEEGAQMYCAQGDFSTLPSVGATAAVNGQIFRIVRLIKTPDDAGLVIGLETPEK